MATRKYYFNGKQAVSLGDLQSNKRHKQQVEDLKHNSSLTEYEELTDDLLNNENYDEADDIDITMLPDPEKVRAKAKVCKLAPAAPSKPKTEIETTTRNIITDGTLTPSILKINKTNHNVESFKLPTLTAANLNLCNCITKMNLGILHEIDLFKPYTLHQDSYGALNKGSFDTAHKQAHYIFQTQTPYESHKQKTSNGLINLCFFAISIVNPRVNAVGISKINLVLNKYGSENCFSYRWELMKNTACTDPENIDYFLMDRDDNSNKKHSENFTQAKAFHRHSPFYENFMNINATDSNYIYHSHAKSFKLPDKNGKPVEAHIVDYEAALQNFFDDMNIYSLADDRSLPNRIYKTKDGAYAKENFTDRLSLESNIAGRNYVTLDFENDKLINQIDLLNHIYELDKTFSKTAPTSFAESCYNLDQLIKTKKDLSAGKILKKPNFNL